MRIVKLISKIVLLSLLTICFVSPVMAQSKGGTLKIEVLNMYSRSFKANARMDIRFTNTSPDDLDSWSTDIKVYDKKGNDLGRSTSMIQDIRSGEIEVQTLIFLGVRASDIASCNAFLTSIMSSSGVREDRKYKLELKWE